MDNIVTPKKIRPTVFVFFVNRGAYVIDNWLGNLPLLMEWRILWVKTQRRWIGLLSVSNQCDGLLLSEIRTNAYAHGICVVPKLQLSILPYNHFNDDDLCFLNGRLSVRTAVLLYH